MICVYDRKEKDFTHNGLTILSECTKAKIVEKINDIYELQLSYPTFIKKSVYLEPFNIIKADDQLFRIYNIEKDGRANLIHINARHIFYDLSNYIIEDRRAVDKNCYDAMEMVIDEVGLGDVYTIESNIEDLKTQYLIRKNAAEAVFMLANRYKGELIRDNFEITINKAAVNDKGVLIKYGKNIIGINEKLNLDSVLTGIYPAGFDGLTLPEKYLINPLWDSSRYPDFKIIKKVEFRDIKNESELRETAQDYLHEHADFSVNYQIDFAQLEHTEEYENYRELQRVEIRDTVTVRHELLNVDLKIKVVGVEKDLLKAVNTKVELGTPLYTIDKYIDDFRDEVDDFTGEVDDFMYDIDSVLDVGDDYTGLKFEDTELVLDEDGLSIRGLGNDDEPFDIRINEDGVGAEHLKIPEIFISALDPDEGEGKDGDVWIKIEGD